MPGTSCSPAPTFEALGYEVGAPRAQPVERRRHRRLGWGSDDVAAGFEGMPNLGGRRGRPRAGATVRRDVVDGGVRVWSLYVPNGREVSNPHYEYKLAWLAALRETAGGLG